jgi:osmoprotectant transport system permease protein
MTTIAMTAPRPALVDKLGVLIALIGLAGALLLPFAAFRANRIVPGEPRFILEALPFGEGLFLALVVALGLMAALLKSPPLLRLAASLFALATLTILMGRSAAFLTPPDNSFARVSPGAGFWVMGFAFALLAADALTRQRLAPVWRILILVAVAAALGLLLGSGAWNQVSILKEYASRADAFWREAQTHVLLAFGSVVIATIAGIPLGILCQRVGWLRAGLLNVLNIIQTIPSIALFGLLIAPLAWVAATVPGAAAIGISGIGAAPVMVALFAYSLLPVVANTVAGLQAVPAAANDAARGMGMTDNQRLAAIELPLAFPVILTGIRIVLVQNIGMATIAALIGGGGFGVFVFQGVGQTAMDLVLLGAVPTVALAFAAAVVLDALVEMVSTKDAAHD